MAEVKSSVAAELEVEHRGLNRDIAFIKSALPSEDEDIDFGHWRLKFLWQLRDFKNRLLKHFDLEELGGFMSEVLTLKPEYTPRVDALKSEHEDVSRQIDDLVERIKNMTRFKKADMKNLRIKVNDLMMTLSHHENEEHELLQRAYYRDYGGGA